MARPKTWGPRIPQIIEYLEGTASLQSFKRREIQKLFRVSVSQAKAIMAAAGVTSYGPGIDSIVSRDNLLAYVRNCPEARRTKRFAGQLASMGREAAARKIKIPMRPGDEWIRFKELDTVEIREEPTCQGSPRRSLTVVFTGMEDLLRQLMLLSKAVNNEPDLFRKMCEESSGRLGFSASTEAVTATER